MGNRCADHVTPLYPQKLALTSPTGGGRSVGIVRSRTKATEFFSSVFFLFEPKFERVYRRHYYYTTYSIRRCDSTQDAVQFVESIVELYDMLYILVDFIRRPTACSTINVHGVNIRKLRLSGQHCRFIRKRFVLITRA